jgi:hypothetical protein
MPMTSAKAMLIVMFCRGLYVLYALASRIRRYTRDGTTVVSLFQETVKRHPNKTAMVMIDDKEWTFRELDHFSNKIANSFYEKVGCRLIIGYKTYLCTV